MATVCASSLALMDAGVRIPKHVGGIALGLIIEGDRHIILTDIAGEEDHYGDIDLKVAGTTDGITGFQMDVKNSRITYDILRQAIAQSGEARRRIIEKMTAAISEPRTAISPYAPRIVSIQIPPSKIGMVIGSGGKTIKAIVERTGAEIDIRDTGEVRIFAPDLAACENAAQEIKDLTAEASVGQVYNGVVTRLMKFGAFVKILPSQEGMVHISEIAHHRVERVEDMLKIGDEITVKVVAIDDMGRVNLSRKQAMSSEDAERERKAGPPPSSRPPRSAQDRHDHRDRRSGPRGNR